VTHDADRILTFLSVKHPAASAALREFQGGAFDVEVRDGDLFVSVQRAASGEFGLWVAGPDRYDSASSDFGGHDDAFPDVHLLIAALDAVLGRQ
jgi:hypothetical protein